MDEEAIFLEALQKTSPEEQAAFLDQACAGDQSLRKNIEQLLTVHERRGDFLQAKPSLSPTLDQPLTERRGTVIGPYKLMEQIGEGGMGLVFVAEQQQPVRRKVALKLIKPGMDTREVIARFEAERQALALMDHPNIARVLDAGATESGRPYFVMELVKGVPITQFCDENRLAPRQRLELFVNVCQAVQHAHQKGIIHRDIKPSNVMVSSHDGRPVVKVIDFGVAKAVGQQLTERTIYTALSQMVGTPLYMSPEQAGMSGLDVDTRTDIYSLGVLLYELLTGTTPFDKERLKNAAFEEVRRIIREEEPQKPSTRISTTDAAPSIAAQRHMVPAKLANLVRGDLDWIVMKALEKDRGRRYETANGFAADVVCYLSDEPVVACPPSAAYRFRKFTRRNRVAFSTAALVLTALVVGTFVSTWQAIRATHAEDLAEIRLAAETVAKSKAVASQMAAEKAHQAEAAQRKIAEERQTEADEQRAEAVRQSSIATVSEQRARSQESLARRRFYASQISLAHQAWGAGNPARVLELLEGLRPKFDEHDPRTFEWFYLWRLCHPGRQLNWRWGQGQVGVVAFSPDGHTLASGGEDGNVKLWDVATGEERAAFKQAGVICLAFSPDGATLCVGSWSHWETALKLWDLATGRELPPLPGVLATVTSVAFFHDGQTVAAATHGGKVYLWDVATRQLKRTLEAHTAHTLIAISPDDKLLATTTWYGDMRTKVWDLAVEPPRVVLDEEGAQCVAFSSDGRTVAAGNNLWDVPIAKRKATLQGHRGAVSSVAFSPDGQTVATAGLDRMVRLWDVATGKQRASQAHGAAVHSVAFAPDGKTLATGSGDGTLKLWDMATTQNPTLLQHTAAVRSVAFSRDGKSLVTAGDFPAKVWDVATGQELATFAVTGAGALSPDTATFAGPGSDNSVKLCDAKTGIERATFRGHTNGVMSFAFSPNSRTLATGCLDKTVKLWDMSTQKLQATLLPPTVAGVSGGAVSSVAFSPDGKTLATGSSFNRVRVWDIASRREGVVLQEHLSSWVWSMVFSPDGKALAAGNDRGTVRLWEVSTGRQLPGFFQGHTDAIRSLAFSPDGQTLATGSDDATARLWDVTTGQERLSLSGHLGSVAAIAFAPDGRTLATGSADGTVKLWRAATDELAAGWKEELNPTDADSPRADNTHGDRLRNAGRIREAEQAYRRAIPRLEQLAREFPHVPTYAQELAVSQLGLSFVLHTGGFSEEAHQAHDLAMNLFEKVASRFANASDPRGELARGYHDLGVKHWTMKQSAEADLAFRQALELYEKLVVDSPTNANYQIMLAQCTYRLSLASAAADRPNEAEELLRRTFAPYERLANAFPGVVAYRTSPVTFCRDVGNALKTRGHLAAAENAFRQGLELSRKLSDESPDVEAYERLLTQCWFDLAVILAAGGKLPEAAIAYQEIVELTPSSAMAHNNLAWLLATCAEPRFRDVRRAVELAKKAVELDPKNAAYPNTLGVALYRSTECKAAIAALENSLELRKGGDSFDWFFLAMAHWQLDNQEEARQWYDKAVEWMDKNAQDNEELLCFRAEAAELLGIKNDE